MKEKNLVQIAKELLEGRQVDEARGGATDEGFYAALSERFGRLGLSEEQMDEIYDYAFEKLKDLMYSDEEVEAILDSQVGRQIVAGLKVDFVSEIMNATSIALGSAPIRTKMKMLIKSL